MPSHLTRPYSITQYARIFVIVNIASFLVARPAIENLFNQRAEKFAHEHPEIAQQSHRRKRETTSPSTPTYPPYLQESIMAPRKGENTKKAAGNAKKAEAAAQKQLAADAAAERDESAKWQQGAKSNKKKAETDEKKADKAAAKAERDRLLAEEESTQPNKPKGAGKKTAEKKSRGTLDLGQLDGDDRKDKTLNASGIDNALDALDLTTDKNGQAIERHPERRFKAAYKVFEERRLAEMDADGSGAGLRRQQRVDQIYKEFQRSPENPFNNSSNIAFDASKEEIAAAKDNLRAGTENRLAEK